MCVGWRENASEDERLDHLWRRHEADLREERMDCRKFGVLVTEKYVCVRFVRKGDCCGFTLIEWIVRLLSRVVDVALRKLVTHSSRCVVMGVVVGSDILEFADDCRGHADLILSEEKLNRTVVGRNGETDERGRVGDQHHQEDIRNIQSSLRELQGVSETLQGTLRGMDSPDLDANSVEELNRSLKQTEANTKDASGALSSLSGEARDMMSSVIANADSTEELTDEIGDLQRNASIAESQLGGLSDETRSLIVSQSAAIGTSHELADELEDIGDEASQSAIQVTGLTGALAGLSATEVSVGGLQTSLGTLTKMKPLILSIASALGGAGLAGGGIEGSIGRYLRRGIAQSQRNEN